MKTAYTVRLPDELLETIKERADKQGISVTELFENALGAYVGSDTDKPDIHDIQKRLEALETKFHQLKEDDKHQDISFKKPRESKQPKKDPAELGELITIQQISQLTGYAVSSLRSKLSRVGIEAVERIDGNRGGLYSKDEILDKIGMK